jgi:hypothetical protein
MKVGDKVKIRNTSRFYLDGSSYNPKDTLGEVINSNQWNALPFLVKWENGEENAYSEEDLDIVEKKDKIVESVISQFKERSEVGIRKYSTTLERNDLTRLEWLTHLQEELMDATLYIQRLKQEYDN